MSKLEAAFAFDFRDSTLAIEGVHARLLSPTIAVAHVRWTMEGAKAPPGAPAPPRIGIQLQVLEKSDGQWRIVSFQNTNSIPHTEFPKAPQFFMNSAGKNAPYVDRIAKTDRSIRSIGTARPLSISPRMDGPSCRAVPLPLPVHPPTMRCSAIAKAVATLSEST